MEVNNTREFGARTFVVNNTRLPVEREVKWYEKYFPFNNKIFTLISIGTAAKNIQTFQKNSKIQLKFNIILFHNIALKCIVINDNLFKWIYQIRLAWKITGSKKAFSWILFMSSTVTFIPSQVQQKRAFCLEKNDESCIVLKLYHHQVTFKLTYILEIDCFQNIWYNFCIVLQILNYCFTEKIILL